MRLSPRIQKILKQGLAKSFGDVDVYLFGSRVDDDKVGGDIDLAIDLDISKEEFRQKKIQFLTALIRMGYDLKVDIVPFKQENALFSNEIKNHCIKI